MKLSWTRSPESLCLDELITVDRWSQICDVRWSKDAEIRHGSVVFVKTDYLADAMSSLAGRGLGVVLVVAESDYAVQVNRSLVDTSDFRVIFARNNVGGAESIPCGLAERWLPHGNLQAVDYARRSEPTCQACSVHCSFALDTNPQERSEALSVAKKIGVDSRMVYDRHVRRPLQYHEFLCNMRSYEFVLSPPGNGIDCHRTWEALYMGCVPIVKRSKLTQRFAEQLPMVLLDYWEHLTNERLNDERKRLLSRVWNSDMLTIGWWEQKIRDCGSSENGHKPVLQPD